MVCKNRNYRNIKHYISCLLFFVMSMILIACDSTGNEQGPELKISGQPQVDTVQLNESGIYQLNLDASDTLGENNTFQWKINDEVVSTQATLSTQLSLGNYVIELVVNEGENQVNKSFTLLVVTNSADQDADTVFDLNDLCPEIYGEYIDGCLSGEQHYIEQCLDCHGDKNGMNVNFGGALTFFECQDCTVKHKMLDTIVTSMPPDSIGSCDEQCANRISDYVIENFDGFDENLTGKLLYEGMCLSCHGDGIKTQGFSAKQLVPATCDVCADEENTILQIKNSMPFSAPANCNEQCARKITTYMRSTFSGYENAVNPEYANLNAKGDLQFEYIESQLLLSWQQRTTTPDKWILERLSESTGLWELMLSAGGEVTSWSDQANTNGLYRLYAITQSIASTPLYGQAPELIVSVDNGQISGTSDSMFFMHKPVSGNFVAEFTLHERNAASLYSKIGLMARATTDADSEHFFGYFNGVNSIELKTRYTTGGDTSWIHDGRATLPVTIRMQRKNNSISIYTKQKDADWVKVGGGLVLLAADVEVGLAFSSNNGDIPLVSKISAFSINDELVTDYNQIDIGTTDKGVISQSKLVTSDETQVDASPIVEPKDLNRFVFTNQLEDISGLENLEFNLTQDDTNSGFEVGINASVLTIEKYLGAAEIYAKEITPVIQSSIDCESADSGCINIFIEKIATQYLRQHPSDKRLESLSNVYWKINDQLGQASAISGLIEALVQSPGFLYQFESDGRNMPIGTLVPVTGTAMAYRLANTLWAGMPDELLLDVALRGELATPEQIKQQAIRMVEDEKAKRGFNLFYRQWLNINELKTIQKDVEDINFDELSRPMMDAMDFYMNSIVFDDQTPSSFEDLLTAPFVATNNALSIITNISSNSEQMALQPTAIEHGDQRTGILGQPAMLSLLGHVDGTSIVHRGVFISQQFMCSGFPPPPDNVPQLDSIDTQGKSVSESLNDLTTVDGCNDCHKFINPVGATFEHFDTVGRVRLHDDLGELVDASAQIYSRSTGEIDGTYNGLKEFNDYLATLDSVKSCFVTQYLTYAMGRVPKTNERNSVSWLVEQLDINEGNIKQMLIEATQTPVFLYKKTNHLESVNIEE
ncbi:MAG: DUF1588 domain-containing protein [Pseudomonadales bacterium]|nr:DUF1588 domain-containing protein [Pseudomonadales bacterium]